MSDVLGLININAPREEIVRSITELIHADIKAAAIIPMDDSVFSDVAWDMALAVIPQLSGDDKEVARIMFDDCIARMSYLEALMMLISDGRAVLESAYEEPANEPVAIVVATIARVLMSLPTRIRYKHVGSVYNCLVEMAGTFPDILCDFTARICNGPFKHGPIKVFDSDTVDILHLHHLGMALLLKAFEVKSDVTTLLERMLFLRPNVQYLMSRCSDIIPETGLMLFPKNGVAVYLSVLTMVTHPHLLMAQVYSHEYMYHALVPYVNLLLGGVNVDKGISLVVNLMVGLHNMSMNDIDVKLMDQLCVLSATTTNEEARKKCTDALRLYVTVLSHDARFDMIKLMLESPFTNIAAYGAYVLKENVNEAWDAEPSKFKSSEVVRLFPLLFPCEAIHDHNKTLQRLDHLHASLLFIEYIQLRGRYRDVTQLTEHRQMISDVKMGLGLCLSKLEQSEEHPVLGRVWLMQNILNRLG